MFALARRHLDGAAVCHRVGGLRPQVLRAAGAGLGAVDRGHREKHIIELDDGKIYRKTLYLMVKTHGFPVNFPLNQSNQHRKSLGKG